MTNYRIPELAKQYTEYDMIKIHTELPDFPDIRTRLLFAFLNKNQLLTNDNELYAFVTSLMQMALDTHEMVPESNANKEKSAARSRQMKVLAGDYFSSRFYHLLSQAGQIDMIRQLSVAVCEVNRLKMNLYLQMKQNKLTEEEYIRQSVSINMQLYLSFSPLFDEAHAACWPEILHDFTRCEVLMQEIYNSGMNHNFQGSWAFWHIMRCGTKEEKKQLQLGDQMDMGKIRALMLRYNVISQLYRMLEEQLNQVNNRLKLLVSEKLVDELRQISKPFLLYVSKPKVLEEI